MMNDTFVTRRLQRVCCIFVEEQLTEFKSGVARSPGSLRVPELVARPLPWVSMLGTNLLHIRRCTAYQQGTCP